MAHVGLVEYFKKIYEGGITLYVYRWGNNPVRAKMKGRICKVICRGKMNSCTIEFIDSGERCITSRNALRKVLDM